jgi:hypothetical protein
MRVRRRYPDKPSGIILTDPKFPLFQGGGAGISGDSSLKLR